MERIPPVMWLVGAAIYVICPLDFDFVPVVGWIDDVAVAYCCIKKWRQAKDAGVAARTPSCNGTGQRAA